MPPSPEPHYSFTIPSIHDDTTLDCRIFHPNLLSRPRSSESNKESEWRKRGIVMAHPYAPMGGSYDDRVVGIVVDEFLKAGYVVGTFNFRGAHTSKGRTSWSGKPELDDYNSFAAFFMHYLAHLHPFPTAATTFTPDQSPVYSQAATQLDSYRPTKEQSPRVILGGYSYGSLILKHLPPVPSILLPFSSPQPGSAASEIVLRARKLADQSNLECINRARDHERKRRKEHEKKLSVTMGGEETSPEKRRSSRDVRRSLDGEGGRAGGKSLDLGSRIRRLSHHRRKGHEAPRTPPDKPHTDTQLTITMPEVRYLLVSPLTPPVSSLAAPGLWSKIWIRKPDDCKDVIGKHTSLAVYGDQDMFSSTKKMREWTDALKEESRARFSSVEVAGAGHFWHEPGVEQRLRGALRDWGGDVDVNM
ncbi:Alpha/Beta hydrolase protein [Massariosphaeria phaeospora]|uniref:Alpha/Beta hydrolase protein n=1 Tax=Massariosphaeria phaeospora TaxID=100035 RepID=A0A7C8I5V2_9PLEO|nr:Alpha/Beta hydrolase protein [Massariosphaeria phaeospora]